MAPGIEFTLNHPLARRVWGMNLQRAIGKESRFRSLGLVGRDMKRAPIIEMDELTTKPGAQITYDIRNAMRGAPIPGDKRLQGREGKLNFLDDDIYINQARNGLKSEGKFSEQLVPYDLRKEMLDAQSDYWAVHEDEMIIAKLSGALGVGDWETLDPAQPTAGARDVEGSVGYDGNDLRAPSSNRIVVAGAGAKNALTAADKFSLDLVDKGLLLATRLQANATTKRKMVPLRINGKNVWICLIDVVHATDLKAAIGSRWGQIELAKIQGGLKGSALAEQSLGAYESAAGTVLFYSHEGLVKFSDFGAGSNVKAARALLMGQSAGRMAYGKESKGDSHVFWHEEKDDRGNGLVVDSGMVYGVQKSAYRIAEGSSTREDFGVMALDAAAAW